MEEKSRLSYLFEKYVSNNCSAGELSEFWSIVETLPDKSPLLKEMRMLWNRDRQEKTAADQVNWKAMEERMKTERALYTMPVRASSVSRFWWAAAAIALLIAAGAYLFTRSPVPSPAQTAQMNDVPPGGSKATLTLSDGTVITLDSAGNRVLQQGVSSIRQQGGQLIYNAGEAKSLSYNTLTTPRGGQFRVTLPDGTKVWLNAASSIRYPAAFVGNERAVEVTGEAYFEVVKDAERPFRVNARSIADISVLGTSFNVNAYPDEAGIYTTLVEGSVRIRNTVSATILKPGQQAKILANDRKPVVRYTNVTQATAWKNDLFSFDQKPVDQIMREISRWYDIDVVFENGIPDVELAGEMGTNVSLSKVILFFQESGFDCRVNYEERKMIIRKK